MANYHLAILERRYLEAILAGRKRIESRFSRTKRSGFGRVSAGDRLFLKEISGPVRAVATAGAVKNLDGLTPEKITELKERYNEGIGAGERYWRNKADCRFGFLVWLEEVKAIGPVRVAKRDWRGWGGTDRAGRLRPDESSRFGKSLIEGFWGGIGLSCYFQLPG